MSTVSSMGSTIYGQEVDLQVQPLNGHGTVFLQNVWWVKMLPISSQSAAVNSDITNLSYLSHIELPKIDTNNVMLHVGTESPGAHIPPELRSGSFDQSYTFRLSDTRNSKDRMYKKNKCPFPKYRWHDFSTAAWKNVDTGLWEIKMN